MIEFKALEYIRAVSEAKTISQAAKNLFISQPALSQHISKIEAKIGSPIFERRGNEMHLTLIGEILLREGQQLLSNREDMMGQISSLLSKKVEIIRFGISSFYSKYYLPLLLPYYHENFPNIRLNIVEKTSLELEQLLIDGELDLCFIPAEPTREGLVYQPIYMEEIMIGLPYNHPVNNHAIASPSGSYLDIKLLEKESFIELIPSLKFSNMSQRILQHFSMSPDVVYRSTNWDTVCTLIANGVGVGFLPEVLRYKHIYEPKFHSIYDIDSTRAYSAVYPKNKRLSHSALNLINIFKDLLSKKKEPNSKD